MLFCVLWFRRRTQELREMAAQSLKHLSATRVMNRDEVEQELQEHPAHGQPAPSAGDATTAAAPGISAPITASAAAGRAPTNPNSSSPRRGVVVDSDAAPWATYDDSDFDM
jgi:hypothetical protein